MSDLTHAEATEMLLWANLTPAERGALRDHLARCPACRNNAAVHVQLARELPRQLSSMANTPAFRARFLREVGRIDRRKQWTGPLYGLAKAVMLALLVAVGWLFWSVQREQVVPAEIGAEPVATDGQVVLADEDTPEPTAVARGSVVVASVPAPSLQGARLEHAAEQTVAIYLPPSYEQSERRYPVVYWLSPGEGPSRGPYGIGEVQQVMDALLASGAVQEMIVVVPPICSSYGCRVFYHNSPANGNWADFLLEDVVGYVDANLRTIADPGARGLGGAAFTATNALDIAMQHPGVFGAVYLKHPLLFAPGTMDDSFILSPQSVQGVLALLDELEGLTPQAAHERFTGFLQERDRLFDQMLAVSYGMTYAPNAEGRAPYFDYLYVAEGEPAADDVWARWEQGYGQIPQKVAQYADALRRLEGLYIEYSPHILTFSWSSEGAPYLAEQLAQQGIPFTLETYVGSAMLDTIPRMEQAMFPFFSETLGGES